MVTARDGEWDLQVLTDERHLPLDVLQSVKYAKEIMAAQAALLEERWAAMQHMGQEIDRAATGGLPSSKMSFRRLSKSFPRYVQAPTVSRHSTRS